MPPHPLAISTEIVKLAPNAEASIYPWKESPETIRQVVERARTFLKAHEPVAAR
jgi:hypothetical protein